MSEKPEKTPLERAMNFLARRGHSAAELTAKLRRAGLTPRDAERAVADCARLGFINDEIYAADCAAMLAARGCGSYKIRQELRKRGVESFLDAALAAVADSEFDRALAAADFKVRMLKNETDRRKRREKLYRFLIGRGFAPAIARRALEETEKRL